MCVCVCECVCVCVCVCGVCVYVGEEGTYEIEGRKEYKIAADLRMLKMLV